MLHAGIARAFAVGCRPGAGLDVAVAVKVIITREITLEDCFRRAKDPTTRYTEDIHIEHFLRILGKGIPVRSITTDMLQTNVTKRAEESGRHGQRLSHETIRKEIGTFASIWNKWGQPQGLNSQGCVAHTEPALSEAEREGTVPAV